MRVITCASYYGTGSSAVTDLFSEFDCIDSLGNYEYRFLQEPDGIADLEYNLIENRHRHNSSDAIKRYLRYLKMEKKMGYGGYDIFGKNLDTITKDYIDGLTELKTHTWCNKDRTDKGLFFCFLDRSYSILRRLLTGNINTEKRFSLLKDREWSYFTSISEEHFLALTREYVDMLLKSVVPEGSKYIMVDQMVSPTNVSRYTRYFNDVKIIVVERDPRDIYLLEKVKWQWGVIPVATPEEFVTWFKITRKNEDNEDSTKVYRLRFEDLVYNYEETKNKLISFVGISKDNHSRPMTKFNPEMSINNTNMQKKIQGYEQDIKYIESHLSEYLYDFENHLEIV